jgi:hypothetical protein
MSDPIGASCRRDFDAYRTSGYRPNSAVKWIVLHDTESGEDSARAVARYFASSSARGSTHLVVDDATCYRTLGNDQVPWGAKGANYAGFHIEQCGYARWSTVVWKRHMGTLRRAAYKTALHCRYFNIPVQWVDRAGLLAGKRGITTHAECSKAFGGSHTDPGKGWPRVIFMGLVRYYHARLVKQGV